MAHYLFSRILSNCQICLEDVESWGSGPLTPFRYPCCQQDVHLQCLANLFRNRRSSACPNCRQQCDRTSDLENLCRQAQIPVEGIAAEHVETIRYQQSDYTGLRTYGINDVPQPNQPLDLIVLCCRNCARGHPFHPIADRRMQWSPNALRNETGIHSWQEMFLCMNCSREIEKDYCQSDQALSSCETCTSPLLWVFDAVSDRGGARCVHCDSDAFPSYGYYFTSDN